MGAQENPGQLFAYRNEKYIKASTTIRRLFIMLCQRLAMHRFQAKSMVIASTPENQRVSLSPSSCFIYSLKTTVSFNISKVNAKVMYFYPLYKLSTLIIVQEAMDWTALLVQIK